LAYCVHKEIVRRGKAGISEQLTEEELVIIDLLTKPDMKLATATSVFDPRRANHTQHAKLRRSSPELVWLENFHCNRRRCYLPIIRAAAISLACAVAFQSILPLASFKVIF
jgi:hypothetical protein